MNKIDQLLAKAMSTQSEEEALACLKMARKHGNTYTGNLGENSNVKQEPKKDNSTSHLHKGHSASYWFDRAEYYYKTWHNSLAMSKTQNDDYLKVLKERNSIKNENIKLKDSASNKSIVIGILTVALVAAILTVFYNLETTPVVASCWLL